MLEVNQIAVKASNGKSLLRDMSFSLGPGQILGLTGQSGAGKTTLIKCVMGILDRTCRMESGSIAVDGINLSKLSAVKRRKLCGTTLGFVPQNPMTAFDSRMKVGRQMIATFRLHLSLSLPAAQALAKEQLQAVNLTDAERVMGSYPNQLSGGMLQRVAMAILMGLHPRYILADEPTSALDETNRLLVLDILREQAKHAGVLMISHDVPGLQSLCETVMVMESGTITETGTMKMLLEQPQQEWTQHFAAANHKQQKGEWEWRES